MVASFAYFEWSFVLFETRYIWKYPIIPFFVSFEVSFSFIFAGLTLAAKDGRLGFAVRDATVLIL